MTDRDEPTRATMVDRVVRLSRHLERAGVPVGVAATIDACRAIEHLDLRFLPPLNSVTCSVGTICARGSERRW